jgi:hypothetical protein
MADTYTIKGGSNVKWGGDGITTLGTLLDHSDKDDAKSEPVPNSMGARVGEVIFDIEKTVSLNVLAPSAGTKPAVGTVIQIDGVPGLLVMSSEKKAEAKGLTKWSLTCTKSTNTTFA